MGNFSRDTFDKLKHYVGVRLQQGVPIVDADWNEMEEIRKYELQAFLKWFVGNGVPYGNDGFRISAVVAANDFAIAGGDGTADGAGRCLVDGMDVMNESTLNYTAQTLYGDNALATEWVVPPLPPLSTPTSDRTDTVYLDVWEREVDSTEDPNLINVAIGIETAVRRKREWVVRVAEDASVPPQPDDADYQVNHSYYGLAIITRRPDDPTILSTDITDIRRTDLTLANMKVPIFIQRGTTVIDSQKFADLLERLRRIYRDRLEQAFLFVEDAPSQNDRDVVYFAIQYITQICTTGALQAKTHNLNNADAIRILATLHDAQQDFLAELEQHGNPDDPEKDALITQYRSRLSRIDDLLRPHQPLNQIEKTLPLQIQSQVFWDVYLRQQEINLWFAITSNLEAARFLSSERSSLIQRAVQQIIQENPNLTQPGGTLYQQRRVAACLRDLEYWLSPVIEACEQNSTQPLDSTLNGAKELLSSLGQPISLYIRCLQIWKEFTGQSPNLSDEAKSIAAAFFDYAINGLS